MFSNDDVTDAQLQTFDGYKAALRGKYGVAAYDSWFRNLSLIAMHQDHVVMATPSNFMASEIRHRFFDGMVEVWKDSVGPIAQISIKGNKNLQAHARNVGLNAPQTPQGSLSSRAPDKFKPSQFNANYGEASFAAAQRKGALAAAKSKAVQKDEVDYKGLAGPLASPLSQYLTFEQFCVGEGNRIALRAARNIVESNDDRLLFLHGGSGRGKTHLLNAIGHAWLVKRPTENVMYLTYDNLLNGYVSAVMSKSVPELRAYLDKIDILIVDDIHLLRGRKATQEELLCLVDRLMARGKSVVIAGGLAPVKLGETGLNQRFADRLSGGLCVQIDIPDYQLRLKILQQLAARDNELGKVFLEEPMLQIIARRCDASVRELEGAYKLARLHAEADRQSDPTAQMNEDKIRNLLQDHLSYRHKEITLEDIKNAVADIFGLSVADLESRRRMQAIAKARHAVCLLARRLTDAPLKQIGAVLNRDHTTVLSSIQRAEVLAETDVAFGDKISRLLEQFGKG